MNWKIEVVPMPVADVDRAKAFYVDQVGFNADHDHRVDESTRFVQLTPPGSACSVVMGDGVVEMEPGTQKGLMAVIPQAEDARRHLLDNGVECSEVDEQPWGRFVYFADPDGNTWALDKADGKEAAKSFAGSGVQLVGTDIKPGTYRSKDNNSCYWARLSGVSGSFDEILVNDNVTGDTVVQILPSDYAFKANRCSSFERIG